MSKSIAAVLTSLDSVTVAGPGAALVLSNPSPSVSMQVDLVSGTGSFQCNLEGSLDGVNFYGLVPIIAAQQASPAMRTTPGIVSSSDTAIVAVRANLIAIGPSQVITATVAAV